MKALLPSDPRLPAVVERLRQGAPLIRESKQLGFTHNGQLREALRGLLGTEEYSRIMSARQSCVRRSGGRQETDSRKEASSRKAAPPVSTPKPEGEEARA